MSKRARKNSRRGDGRGGNADVLVTPSDTELAALQKVFKPVAALDLRKLVEEAETKGVTPEQLRSQRCQKQIDEIFRRLKLRGDAERNWRVAFLLLAMTSLGIGRVTYSPKRSNTNARTWQSDDERRLIVMMSRLSEKGYTERQATDRIAADPEASQVLPYKGHGTQYSGETGQARRASAIRAQLSRIKKKYPGDLMEIFSPPDRPKSPLKRQLRELELGPQFARLAGDKRKG